MHPKSLLRWSPLPLLLVVAGCAGGQVGDDADATEAALSTLTFTPTADAEVRQASPNTNYGSSTELGADLSPVRQSFLRFHVSGVKGTVTKAVFRCYATNGSTNGPRMNLTTGAWTETGLTWNNKPATGTELTNSGTVGVNNWFTRDISWALRDVNASSNGNGSADVNLTLDADSTDAVVCESREATAANRPQLVLSVTPAAVADAGTPVKPDAGTPVKPDAGVPVKPDAGVPVSTGLVCPSGLTHEVFRDEFNGTSLDTSKWSAHNGPVQPSGGDFTKLTNMLRGNVSVSNGVLHIASHRYCADPYANPSTPVHPTQCAGANYYSGGWIVANGSWGAGHGLIMFLAQPPTPQPGTWPGIWARNTAGDTNYGEFDLLESYWDTTSKGVASDPNLSTTTTIFTNSYIMTSQKLIGPFPNLTTQFHVFEVEWNTTVSPATVTYYYRDSPSAARQVVKTVSSQSPGLSGRISEQQVDAALSLPWRPYLDFAVEPRDDNPWRVSPDSAATYNPPDLQVDAVVECTP